MYKDPTDDILDNKMKMQRKEAITINVILVGVTNITCWIPSSVFYLVSAFVDEFLSVLTITINFLFTPPPSSRNVPQRFRCRLGQGHLTFSSFWQILRAKSMLGVECFSWSGADRPAQQCGPGHHFRFRRKCGGHREPQLPVRGAWRAVQHDLHCEVGPSVSLAQFHPDLHCEVGPSVSLAQFQHDLYCEVGPSVSLAQFQHDLHCEVGPSVSLAQFTMTCTVRWGPLSLSLSSPWPALWGVDLCLSRSVSTWPALWGGDLCLSRSVSPVLVSFSPPSSLSLSSLTHSLPFSVCSLFLSFSVSLTLHLFLSLYLSFSHSHTFSLSSLSLSLSDLLALSLSMSLSALSLSLSPLFHYLSLSVSIPFCHCISPLTLMFSLSSLSHCLSLSVSVLLSLFLSLSLSAISLSLTLSLPLLSLSHYPLFLFLSFSFPLFSLSFALSLLALSSLTLSHSLTHSLTHLFLSVSSCPALCVLFSPRLCFSLSFSACVSISNRTNTTGRKTYTISFSLQFWQRWRNQLEPLDREADEPG